MTRAQTTRPLRVGFLTPTIALGGAGRWLESLARHLPAVSHDQIAVAGVAVVPNPSSSPSRELEAPIGRHARILNGDESVAALAAECDVLVAWGLRHLDSVPDDFAGPVVFVSHGNCQWTRDLVSRCQTRATHWAAVSQNAAEAFPHTSRVAILHNGVETEHCRALIPRQSMRDSWGLEPGEIAVGYVGRLAPEKNPADVARAVAALGKPFRAVIVGDGWARPQIMADAHSILPDLVYQPAVTRVGDVLGALDCFLLTSPSEGFSLGLAEAWCAGLATVATRVGALPELEPIHGRLSVTVPVGASPAILAAGVVVAIAPANVPVVDRAQDVVRQHFTAQAMAQRWADWLTAIT